MPGLESHYWSTLPEASDGACRPRVVGWEQCEKGGRLKAMVGSEMLVEIGLVKNGDAMCNAKRDCPHHH